MRSSSRLEDWDSGRVVANTSITVWLNRHKGAVVWALKCPQVISSSIRCDPGLPLPLLSLEERIIANALIAIGSRSLRCAPGFLRANLTRNGHLGLVLWAADKDLKAAREFPTSRHVASFPI